MLDKIKKADGLFYGSLFLLSILVFAIPYGLQPVLMADSPAYLAGTINQGIVPVYPLFIAMNKLVFSIHYYLQAVVIEQILLAACATVYFVLFIKRAMGAGKIETYLLLLFSLIPYTVLMPDGMTSRFIVTEALAYPCFYLLMAVSLKGLWEEKFFAVALAEMIAIFMALTRTQLQLVLLIPVGIFFVLWVRGKARNEKMRKIFRVITGIFLSGMIFILSYGIYRQGNLALRKALVWTESAADLYVESQMAGESTGKKEEREEKIEAETEEKLAEENEEETGENTPQAEVLEVREAAANPEADSQNIASQFSTVLFVKVMIMAEREDAALFADDSMRRLYLYVYDRLAQDQLVFAAMDKNLLIGDQLQAGLDKISRVLGLYIGDFVLENPDFEADFSTVRNEFSLVLLKAHPLRWMVSGILQIPFGLISSVFIHRRNMYWISYLATAILYGLAVGLCVARKKDASRKDFMILCIGVNLLFVVATSMVFVSQKRYVNYGFGTFYISLYFMIKSCVIDVIRKTQGNKEEAAK